MRRRARRRGTAGGVKPCFAHRFCAWGAQTAEKIKNFSEKVHFHGKTKKRQIGTFFGQVIDYIITPFAKICQYFPCKKVYIFGTAFGTKRWRGDHAKDKTILDRRVGAFADGMLGVCLYGAEHPAGVGVDRQRPDGGVRFRVGGRRLFQGRWPRRPARKTARRNIGAARCAASSLPTRRGTSPWKR